MEFIGIDKYHKMEAGGGGRKMSISTRSWKHRTTFMAEKS